MEHCISALKEYREDMRFRVYVTDALRAVADNTTQIYTLKGLVNYGKRMNARFADGIPALYRSKAKRKPESGKETESKEAVISRIKEGLKKIGK